MRISGGSLVLAAGRNGVHEVPVGNSTMLKGFFKLLTPRFAAGSAVGGQRDQVAAVIVEHGQGADRLRPPPWSLEVHLPQLIRLFSFKALQHGWMLVCLTNQIMTQQNAVNRVAWQNDSFTRQYHTELACAPVRVAEPHLHYPLLQTISGSPRTSVRLPAALRNASPTEFLIASQPQIPARP